MRVLYKSMKQAVELPQDCKLKGFLVKDQEAWWTKVRTVTVIVVL